MKAAALPYRRNAFTLVELVTVMAIIMVLAGLTIGGLQYFRQKANIKKAQNQVQLISNALERYKLDNGEYPKADSGDGKGQSNELYEALYLNGFTNNGKIYLDELDPNNRSQGVWVKGTGSAATIVDPFGEEYRYRSGSATQRNPDFDLWSAGPNKATDGGAPTASKDNEDDIW